MVRSKRLSGINPLAYLGVEPDTPLQFTVQNRAPTSNDYKNWNIGSIWLNSSAQDVWMLVSKSSQVATWNMFGGSASSLQTLTGDTGGAVGPDGGLNINIVSGVSALSVDGNPLTNTLTLNTDGTIASVYTTDSGNAIPSSDILNILGGLNVNTSGAGNTVTINMDNLGGPGVVVTDNSGIMSSINGTDGQLIIGATGADPAWATVTSSDASITITGGPNTLDLVAVAAAGVMAGDNINISGSVTVNLNETIHWPNTNAAGTSGIIYLGGSGGSGGDRFLHNYGSSGLNVFLGTDAGNLTLDATKAHNIGVGPEALMSLDEGVQNVALGKSSMTLADNCNNNVAIGTDCLSSLNGSFPSATQNTFVGYKSGESLTTGSFNTAFGEQSLSNLTTGEYNIVMGSGSFSGGAYTSSESSNLIIGNNGVVGESNTIRIGTTGSGNGQQNKCYIAGIFGVTTTGGTAVYVNSSGQLGTVVSSRRFKENIEDMGDQSKPIMDLRPVTFNYKEDITQEKQWGLIAEEVAEIIPDIVVKDEENEIHSVQYNKLIPMLLNEAQKLSLRIKTLEGIVSKKGVKDVTG